MTNKKRLLSISIMATFLTGCFSNDDSTDTSRQAYGNTAGAIGFTASTSTSTVQADTQSNTTSERSIITDKCSDIVKITSENGQSKLTPVLETNQYHLCTVNQMITTNESLILRGNFANFLPHDPAEPNYTTCLIMSIPLNANRGEVMCLKKGVQSNYNIRELKTDIAGNYLYIPLQISAGPTNPISTTSLQIWDGTKFRIPFETQTTSWSGPNVFVNNGEYHSFSYEANSNALLYLANKHSQDQEGWELLYRENDTFFGTRTLQHKNMLVTNDYNEVNDYFERLIVDLDTGERLYATESEKLSITMTEDFEGRNKSYFHSNSNCLYEFDPETMRVGLFDANNSSSCISGKFVESRSEQSHALYVHDKQDGVLTYIDLNSDMYFSENLLEREEFTQLDYITDVLRWSNGIFAIGNVGGQPLQVYHNMDLDTVEVFEIPPSEVSVPIIILPPEGDASF
jgi:hypothetical protein